MDSLMNVPLHEPRAHEGHVTIDDSSLPTSTMRCAIRPRMTHTANGHIQIYHHRRYHSVPGSDPDPDPDIRYSRHSDLES
eukprot:2966802-Alexandrium_andersonii.AAC.1